MAAEFSERENAEIWLNRDDKVRGRITRLCLSVSMSPTQRIPTESQMPAISPTAYYVRQEKGKWR